MNDSSKKPQAMPSILDKELEQRSSDAFGHQDYADTLRDLIEAPTNRPPFSIGLLGPWGTGKSSIKALYRHDLGADNTGTVGNRRSDRIHVISFNAWRFGGEHDLKRALLRETFKQLGGNEAALRRELFEQVNKVTPEKRQFKEWFAESFGQLIGSATILLLLFIAAIAITWFFAWSIGLKEQYSLGAIFVAATLLTGWLGKTIVDLRVRSPARFLPQTSISFPATSAEEYERLLTDQIAEFRRSIGQKCERLVVFVDDLDRLSAPEMVAGLDAIRTFLELPFNTTDNDFGVVFVISCDEDKVAEAIKRRSGLGSPDLPGAVFSRGDARRYLDRLFQFRLEIPQFPKRDMRDFALKKLQGMESVAADLKKRKVALEDVIDRLIHVDVQSPRNAIQLLNAFIQSWWIGSLRERNGIGSNAPGVLYKGAVTDHPLSLAALCVLRVDFPDFYDAIQNRPELIQDFRSTVFNGKPPSDLAPQAQELLGKFLDTDKGGMLTSKVRADHRKLRRYLSSLADQRWPIVLQPLLRLAEDSITRKFGDSAAVVFDSLVSGDVEGVLEGFGRNLDDKQLSGDDVLLLEGFGETLPQETEARRTNAARVFAALVDRIPQERKRRILSPLIRQMVALKDVRMNIQPSRAQQIIEGAAAEDRRDVAETFIADLLSMKPLDWRLATGGEPNLSEVIDAVRDAVDLALEVKVSDGLSAASDATLKDWLLKREIRLGDESQTLPFTDLEAWVERHSAILPAFLATDYSNQVIGEFETAERPPDFTPAVLPRISSIFADTAALGQEGRELLWSQLTRLVGVQSQTAAEAAWGDAASYSDLATPAERRTYLIAFATRLRKEIQDEENWPLDGPEGATRFNDLISGWCADIDQETAPELEKLILLWAKDVSRVQFSLRALDILKEQVKESWDRVISALCKLEIAARPIPVSAYLARNFGEIDTDGKNRLVTKVDALINENEPDKNSIKSYDTLVKAMPDVAWSEAPLNGHLERLLDRINEMHNNATYLSHLLPVSAGVFKFAANEKVQQILTSLFANAAGTPNAYITAHRCMIGVWPKPDAQIGDYKPDNIVARACQFIREQSHNAGISDVYESICDLAQRDLSGATSNQGIAGVTPIVWCMKPGCVSALSNFVATVLAPENIATILTEPQAEDLMYEDLSALLADTSKTFDEENLYNTALLILDSPAVPLLEMPDGALELWISALTNNEPTLVIKLLSDDNLNDEQRMRILARISDAKLAETPASVEAQLKNTTKPRTKTSLINRLDQVGAACSSESSKSKLAEHLIASLPSVSGEEFHSVAKQVSRLGGKNSLERNSKILDMLDEEQSAVLAKAFPSSGRLRKSLKLSEG
tara:strand:- start:14389 stop:18447 length:4059 start_codon:yes stop_codon:yes gene_type:complete